jgi:hypothetical protein
MVNRRRVVKRIGMAALEDDRSRNRDPGGLSTAFPPHDAPSAWWRGSRETVCPLAAAPAARELPPAAIGATTAPGTEEYAMSADLTALRMLKNLVTFVKPVDP